MNTASIARELNLEPALVEAVALQESKGKPFRNGRPAILFERHVFRRNLKKLGIDYERLVADDPELDEIINPRPYTGRRVAPNRDRYGSHAQQWDRFERAITISEAGAIRAISIGRYQVLGENWKMCGFKSEVDFFDACYTEEGQLRAFVGYLKGRSGTIEALRDHNWLKFKKLYNGPKIIDRDGDGVDDYAQSIAKHYARLIQRDAGVGKLRKSRTVKANVTDIALKTGGIGGGATYGVEVLREKIDGWKSQVDEVQGLSDQAKQLGDTVGVNSLGENISEISETMGWLPWAIGIIIILVLIPNVRMLYTYMQDTGRIQSPRERGRLKNYYDEG